MTRTRFLAAGLLLAAVVPLAACGGGGDPLAPASSPAAGGSTGAAGSVKVGSADFPESALLAEIYAQALEAKGMTAARQFNIGSRETYLKAISGGEVDVLPEYTGSLLTYYDKAAKATQPDEVYASLQKAVPQGLTVLDKSVAEDKDSIAVTKQTADEWSLKAIPDLAAHQDEPDPRRPAGVQDPPARPRRPRVRLQGDAQGVPSAAEPGHGRGAEERPGQGRQHLQHRPVDRCQRLRRARRPAEPLRLRQRRAARPLRQGRLAQGELSTRSRPRLDTTSLADMVKQVVVDKKDASEVAKTWLASAGLA